MARSRTKGRQLEKNKISLGEKKRKEVSRFLKQEENKVINNGYCYGGKIICPNLPLNMRVIDVRYFQMISNIWRFFRTHGSLNILLNLLGT
jgi:hypothetical protein